MKRNKMMLLKVFENHRVQCKKDEECLEEPTNVVASSTVTHTIGNRQLEDSNINDLDDLNKNKNFQNQRKLPPKDKGAIAAPVSLQDHEEYASTPETPKYSPITPIDRKSFLSLNNNNITNSDSSSEGSSPLRPMTPKTQTMFNELSDSRILDFSDDDSVKDPDYINDTDANDSSFDENEVETTLPGMSSGTQHGIIKNNSNDHDKPMRDVTQCNLSSSIPLSRLTQNTFSPRALKRRHSETDLMSQPLKKSKRCASIAELLLPDPPQRAVPTSPKKKHVSDPSRWKRNVNRYKRLRGESYTTIKGKCKDAAPLKQPDCLTKPKHQCGAKVPEEARKTIYKSFRALETLDGQRNFIIRHVSKEPKARSTTKGPSRKVSTNHYSLTVSGEKVDVCREFFLSTLNIKEGIVRGALSKITKEGVLGADKRGKRAPPNKLSAMRFNLIKDHILSFPTMESHYCRKNSEYKYLESGLNVQIMYSLYKKKCEEQGTAPACIEKYRQVFRSYKLRFHVPKKDMCKKCVARKEQGEENLTENEKGSHAMHLQRRDQAYSRRDVDKEAAKADKSTFAFNFDLQAVLSTPKGASGPFYYSRKLAVYNLTFYEFGDQDVECYTWDETEGKRGSIEIATCVYKYITSKPGITHVRMMSDNCGGQQKNFNFSCMLLHLVTNHPTIETLDHVFFESGHSHMECDSIHSKIEQKCKNCAVYSPDGWIQVMRLARTNPRPFNVNVLSHGEFLNFNSNKTQFAEEVTKKQKKTKGKKKGTQENNDSPIINENTKNEKTNFQSSVWIQYRKCCPDSIFIKTGYEDDNFKELKIKNKKGKDTSIEPKSVYTERIPISKLKKRDLLKLCQENQIPRYYHSFYENLPDSENVVDQLPEPDATEEDEV